MLKIRTVWFRSLPTDHLSAATDHLPAATDHLPAPPIRATSRRLRITSRRPPIRATSRRLRITSRRPPIRATSRRLRITRLRITSRWPPIRATSERLVKSNSHHILKALRASTFERMPEARRAESLSHAAADRAYRRPAYRCLRSWRCGPGCVPEAVAELLRARREIGGWRCPPCDRDGTARHEIGKIAMARAGLGRLADEHAGCRRVQATI